MDISVDTPVGMAEYVLRRPPGRGRTQAILVIGHGAGGDLNAPDLAALTEAALSAGFAVAGVRQPYRVLGRRAPAPAPQLDAAWSAVVHAVRTSKEIPRARSLPVAVAGRSSGARVACRTASELGVGAILALAFPLHPPGRPEKSRAAELDVDVPLRVLQGSRDAFGKAAEFPVGIEVVVVDGADHGLKAAGVAAALADSVRWLVAVLGLSTGIGSANAAL
jgi:predicted alpha/beta-hydrolase family hydrolase